jgi:saccharopine dehydrogenase-like NADP-dependent oxidoreductase
MTKVLILGAYGEIARVATRLFLEQTDVQLTLYLRNAKRLKKVGHERVRVTGTVRIDTPFWQQSLDGRPAHCSLYRGG